MDINGIESFARGFIDSDENRLSSEQALDPAFVGHSVFDYPVFAFGRHDNAYLVGLRHVPEAGAPLMPPDEWLPSAKTVISYFLPLTERIRRSNYGGDYPSGAWMNGRIEGQGILTRFSCLLRDRLVEKGYDAVAPPADPRFEQFSIAKAHSGSAMSVNWSERHVGYGCGLGTFSLSKGLITKRGMAGRIGSVITSLELPPTAPDYGSLTEYCIQCSACVGNCPVAAISLDGGKDDQLCLGMLNTVLAKRSPYYGCGKCQVNVPCECRIP